MVHLTVNVRKFNGTQSSLPAGFPIILVTLQSRTLGLEAWMTDCEAWKSHELPVRARVSSLGIDTLEHHITLMVEDQCNIFYMNLVFDYGMAHGIVGRVLEADLRSIGCAGSGPVCLAFWLSFTYKHTHTHTHTHTCLCHQAVYFGGSGQ